MLSNCLAGKLRNNKCGGVDAGVIVLQILSSQRRDDIAWGLTCHPGVNRGTLTGLGAQHEANLPGGVRGDGRESIGDAAALKDLAAHGGQGLDDGKVEPIKRMTTIVRARGGQPFSQDLNLADGLTRWTQPECKRCLRASRHGAGHGKRAPQIEPQRGPL